MRLLLATMLATGVLYAQPRSQISGFVRDSSGAMVQQASIAILNLDTGIRRSTQTNGEGFYAVSSLTPGQYKITVRKPGFSTVARTGIALHAMDSERLDFTMEIGGVREEITVESTPTFLNVTDASYGASTTRAPAESLPVNGRGLQGLIDLAPGVLITPATGGESGQFSANGQRPATNYFTVDGVSANNGVSGSGLPGQFSGTALPAMTAIGSLHNLVSLSELDELRVQTSTYAPEYGRLPGAQVAISTRSGSNAFHGEVFGGFRHERLAAGDWFANAAGLPRAPQRLESAGGSFGGPLVRNQSFFLVSTEYMSMRQASAFQTFVPSAAAREAAPSWVRPLVNAWPVANGPVLSNSGGDLALHTARTENPASLSSTSVRLDQSTGSAGSVFVRYNRTPSSNRFGYLQRTVADFSNQSFTAGAVSVIGARLTNDWRAGVSRVQVDTSWLPGAADIDLPKLLPEPGTGQRLYGVAVRGWSQLLTGDPGTSRQSLWNIADVLAFTAGRHDLRLGLDYQRLAPVRDRRIDSVMLVFDDYRRLLRGEIPAFTLAQAGGGSSLIETFSTFAQDTWHVTPRLNVTWGVRWELTPPPAYRQPQMNTLPPTMGQFGAEATLVTAEMPVWRTRLNQFAPRAGAALRLGSGTVLRAGGGVFYDLGFSSAVDLVNGLPYNRWRNPVTTTVTPEVLYGFAPNLKLPFTTHWNITLERALSADSAISAAYVGSAGERLLRREGTRSLVLATNHGYSRYHSLQMQYRSRDVRGLQGTVSYVWAHALDNGSWDSAVWLLENGSDDRGPANFDVRHSIQAALSWDPGRLDALRWARGWQLSGAFRLRSGFPVDIVTTDQPFGLGFDNDARPDLVSGVPVWIVDRSVPGGRRLNSEAFRTPEAGRQGSLGRNAIRGNGLAQLDLAVRRSFALTERVRLQFRAEAYNAMNSPSFADPMRILSSPLFGRSVSQMNLMLGSGRPDSGLAPSLQSGGSRVFQAGLTLRF